MKSLHISNKQIELLLMILQPVLEDWEWTPAETKRIKLLNTKLIELKQKNIKA